MVSFLLWQSKKPLNLKFATLLLGQIMCLAKSTGYTPIKYLRHHQLECTLPLVVLSSEVKETSCCQDNWPWVWLWFSSLIKNLKCKITRVKGRSNWERKICKSFKMLSRLKRSSKRRERNSGKRRETSSLVMTPSQRLSLILILKNLWMMRSQLCRLVNWENKSLVLMTMFNHSPMCLSLVRVCLASVWWVPLPINHSSHLISSTQLNKISRILLKPRKGMSSIKRRKSKKPKAPRIKRNRKR
jgi:hypothetical protein